MMPEQQTNDVNQAWAAKDADRHWNDGVERLKFASEYALGGLKGLLLANGGAIVALLTFVGNAKLERIDHHCIRYAFACFSVGLVATLMTYILGYVSQAYYWQASIRRSRQADSAAHGTGQTFSHKDQDTRGSRAEYWGIGWAIMSLLSFLVGSFVALNAIT